MPGFAEVASRPDPKTPSGVAIRPFRTPSPCEYAKLWAWFTEAEVQSHSIGPAMEPAKVKWVMSVYVISEAHSSGAAGDATRLGARP